MNRLLARPGLLLLLVVVLVVGGFGSWIAWSKSRCFDPFTCGNLTAHTSKVIVSSDSGDDATRLAASSDMPGVWVLADKGATLVHVADDGSVQARVALPFAANAVRAGGGAVFISGQSGAAAVYSPAGAVEWTNEHAGEHTVWSGLAPVNGSFYVVEKSPPGRPLPVPADGWPTDAVERETDEMLVARNLYSLYGYAPNGSANETQLPASEYGDVRVGGFENGAFWVRVDRKIEKVDPISKSIRRVATLGRDAPGDRAAVVGGGRVWVATDHATNFHSGHTAPTDNEQLAIVDEKTGNVNEVTDPSSSDCLNGLSWSTVQGRLWTRCSDRVARIDPAGLRVDAATRCGGSDPSIGVDQGGTTWVVNDRDQLVSITVPTAREPRR